MVSHRFSVQEVVRLFDQVRPLLAARFSPDTLYHLRTSWYSLTLAATTLTDEAVANDSKDSVDSRDSVADPAHQDRIAVPIPIRSGDARVGGDASVGGRARDRIDASRRTG